MRTSAGGRLTRALLRDHRRGVALALVAGLAAELAVVAGPWAIQRAIDDGVRRDDLAALLGWSAAIVVLGGSAAMLTRVRQKVDWVTGARAVATVRARVDLAVRDPARTPNLPDPGDLHSRVQRDGESLWSWMSNVSETVIAIVVGAVITVAIVVIDPWLALIAIGAAGIAGGAAVVFPPAAERRAARLSDARARGSALLDDLVHGNETIRGAGGESRMVSRLDEANAAVRSAGMGLARLDAAWSATSRGAVLLGMAAGLVVGTRALVAGQIEVGQMLSYIAWMGMLADIAATLVGQQLSRRAGRAAAERIATIVDAQAPSAPDVVDEASVVLHRGDVVAVVGPTGSGKSVLLRRWATHPELVNLHDDDERVDHPRVALVTSSPGMVTGSIADNIVLGAAVHSGDIERSARTAGIHDEIEALEDGYDTQLATLGTGLSGGQRQRIAVARALLRTPDVLLMDEAMSTIDGDAATELIARIAHSVPRPALVIGTSRPLAVAPTQTITLGPS